MMVEAGTWQVRWDQTDLQKQVKELRAKTALACTVS